MFIRGKTHLRNKNSLKFEWGRYSEAELILENCKNNTKGFQNVSRLANPVVKNLFAVITLHFTLIF